MLHAVRPKLLPVMQFVSTPQIRILSGLVLLVEATGEYRLLSRRAQVRFLLSP